MRGVTPRALASISGPAGSSAWCCPISGRWQRVCVEHPSSQQESSCAARCSGTFTDTNEYEEEPVKTSAQAKVIAVSRRRPLTKAAASPASARAGTTKLVVKKAAAAKPAKKASAPKTGRLRGTGGFRRCARSSRRLRVNWLSARRRGGDLPEAIRGHFYFVRARLESPGSDDDLTGTKRAVSDELDSSLPIDLLIA